MANVTQDNIKKKRKTMKRRRRVQIFRLVFMCVLIALLGAAILFLGMSVYNVGNHVYSEFNSMYQGYNDRKTAKLGAVDPKFDGYTNILILGVDDAEQGNAQADTILVRFFVGATWKFIQLGRRKFNCSPCFRTFGNFNSPICCNRNEYFC